MTLVYSVCTFNALSILQDIVLRLRRQAKGEQNGDKVTIYSGHDNTIIPLLLSLGYRMPTWPPYASRLILELYKSRDNTHYIRLVYNGVDITRNISICTTPDSAAGLCPLTNLSSFFEDLLPNMGQSDIRAACKN